MKKMKNAISKSALLVLALATLAVSLVGCALNFGVKEVPTEKEYTFTNPEPELAKTDEGFTIDGIADEEVYKNANWLYLSNVLILGEGFKLGLYCRCRTV